MNLIDVIYTEWKITNGIETEENMIERKKRKEKPIKSFHIGNEENENATNLKIRQIKWNKFSEMNFICWV